MEKERLAEYLEQYHMGALNAATDQEVRSTIAHLPTRISGIAAAIRGLDRTLEREDTAQTRLPLDGGDTP